MKVGNKKYEMFQTVIAENIKTHILCSIKFFPNNVPFMR